MILPLARKSWMISKNSNIDCISTAQVRWCIEQLFNWNTSNCSRCWVEKKKKKEKTLASEDWINSFILREYSLIHYKKM